MADWVTAARQGEIGPGQVKVLVVEGQRLAVCNVDGEYHCIDDVCTHDGGSFDQVELEDNEIECPRHGARFDVRTGKALCFPAVMPVKTHQVRVEGGEIQVKVDG